MSKENKTKISKVITRISAGAALGVMTYFLLKEGDKKIVDSNPSKDTSKSELFI